MQITELKPSRHGRVRIFADGEYAASADSDALIEAGMHVGDEYTDEQFSEILRKAEKRAAREKALRLLTFRDHSRAELEEKVARSCDAEAAAEAAQEMERLGLVNDVDYAKKFARELCIQKCYSRSRALHEMQRRGIDRELASQALDELEPNPQQQIEKLLSKKYPRGILNENDSRRAAALLARYGFRWEDIRQAMNHYGVEE